MATSGVINHALSNVVGGAAPGLAADCLCHPRCLQVLDPKSKWQSNILQGHSFDSMDDSASKDACKHITRASGTNPLQPWPECANPPTPLTLLLGISFLSVAGMALCRS